jgi:hypothetical protein
MQTLIDKLTRRRRDRSRTALERYEKLVEALADARELDVDETDRILTAANKSPDDLRAAAELILKRREWAAELPKRVTLQAELKKLEEEQAAGVEAVRVAKERSQAIWERTNERRTQIQGQLSRIDEAERQLRETSPANRQGADILQQVVPAVLRLEEIERELEKNRGWLRQSEQQPDTDQKEKRDLIARYKARIGELEQEKSRLTQRVEPAQKQAGELFEKSLVS